MSIKNKVIELLSESASKNLSKFPDSLTEVEFIELIMSIEDKLNVEIIDEDAEKISNFDELITIIEESEGFDIQQAA